MVRDAELAFDDFRDTGASPDIAEKPEGWGAARQEGRTFSKLVRSEAGGRAGRGTGAQGLNATVASAFEPLADGTLGDTEALGNPALRPALLM